MFPSFLYMKVVFPRTPPMPAWPLMNLSMLLLRKSRVLARPYLGTQHELAHIFLALASSVRSTPPHPAPAELALGSLILFRDAS